MPSRTVRSLTLAALAVAVVLPLGGCGESDSGTADEGGAAAGSGAAAAGAGDGECKWEADYYEDSARIDADGDVTFNGSYDPLSTTAPPDTAVTLDPQEIESLMAACGRAMPTAEPTADPTAEGGVDEGEGPSPTAQPTVPPAPSRDPQRPNAWLDDETFTEGALSNGFQIVVAPGVSAAQARRALGPVRAPGEDDISGRVGITEHGGAAVLFTDAYIPDEITERLSRLSPSSRLATCGSSINRDDRVLVLQNGRILRHFDPLLAQSYDGTSPLPEEKGLDLENDTEAASITLLERLTGVDLTRAVVDRALGSAVVPLDRDLFPVYDE
ncbi:DUF6461 domain-containing protein [Nocardioides sp.]|uniref:DUF6461 domain-containing protein n=1 Tax=Nocardioides sp. TaxID=35761 RepID=UPI0035132799